MKVKVRCAICRKTFEAYAYRERKCCSFECGVKYRSRKRRELVDGKLFCWKCKLWKIPDEFYNAANLPFGKTSQCRACQHAYGVAYRASGRARIVKRQAKYGMSQEDFDARWCKQKGRCLICKRKFLKSSKRWNVDHCHSTGEVRGLLCRSCNKGLGFFNDSPASLLAAVEYLGGVQNLV